MERIERNVVLLHVLPHVRPSPTNQRAKLVNVVSPVERDHRLLGSVLGLGSSQTRDPNFIRFDVFDHRLNLANVTAQVLVRFPKLGTVLIGLLFGRD